MASQVDMFASQDNVVEENLVTNTPRVASTCPAKLNFWKWVVIFDWDDSVKCPFSIYSTTKLGGEIKDSWLKSVLSTTSRKKPLNLSALENKTVSLFGKVDSSKCFQTS